MSTHTLIEATHKILPAIESAADDIEANQRIPDSIIKQISDAGLFRAALPKEFGGDEIDPLIMFDALEAMAMADASTAWVTLIISANPYLFGHALTEQTWQTMFGQDPDTATAGALPPNGRAVKVDGGYQVSGHWKYGSGSEHCKYLLSGCMVFDDDKPKFNEHGHPHLIWAIHSLDDCELLMDSWNTTGLRGTSSHDYVIKDLHVKDDWMFEVGSEVFKLNNPVYNFSTIPFSQLAGITLGLARKAINIIKDVAPTKRRGPLPMIEDPTLQLQVAQAEAMIDSARLYIKDVVGDLLETLSRGNELTTTQRAKFRLASTYTLEQSVEVVNMMYKQGGGHAIYRNSPLERVFRDINTAATHIQFNDLTNVKAGRMLLGLDPQDPLF